MDIGRVGTEYMHHTFQKLRKGKLITIGKAQKELSDNGNKFIYKINGKKTTEKIPIVLFKNVWECWWCKVKQGYKTEFENDKIDFHIKICFGIFKSLLYYVYCV